ncbi:hypothetical protein A1O1_00085 [Capronia coronata CBS 617.96]|uniref:Clr5 domain-containing protein n=1 Tax=Capronia coronata CBS 617.96 TaxID=1182541 RepID=W9YPY3_9EURO|nr:uncharacterized protein A1O1_00085 [Capronia coronata CBS 617.96]EXJ94967.1 hypothetical protein A1O1_00085 [Capronia coronata CBS 617.96]
MGPKGRRKRAPSEAEWERIKEPLRRLCIVQRLPLWRIADILKQDYEFDAAIGPCGRNGSVLRQGRNTSPKSDSQRLGSDTACQTPSPDPSQDDGDHPSRTLSTSRHGIIQTGKGTNTNHSLHSNQRAVARSTLIPMAALHHSDDLRDFEHILRQVKKYFEWRLRNEPPPKTRSAEGWGVETTRSVNPVDFFFDVGCYCDEGARGGESISTATFLTKLRTDTVAMLQHEDEGLLCALLDYCNDFIPKSGFAQSFWRSRGFFLILRLFALNTLANISEARMDLAKVHDYLTQICVGLFKLYGPDGRLARKTLLHLVRIERLQVAQGLGNDNRAGYVAETDPEDHLQNFIDTIDGIQQEMEQLELGINEGDEAIGPGEMPWDIKHSSSNDDVSRGSDTETNNLEPQLADLGSSGK